MLIVLVLYCKMSIRVNKRIVLYCIDGRPLSAGAVANTRGLDSNPGRTNHSRIQSHNMWQCFPAQVHPKHKNIHARKNIKC